MKKFLTYSVVIATIAWSMGISAVLPAAAAYTPTDGDLIKTATYPAVYYVSGGKKYLFVNRATFGTWRADFSGLKVVSQADFDSVNLGGNVTARPGVNLVKFDNSDNVYAVTPGAVLVKVEAAAKTALYGSAAPIVIQSSFEANYTKSADVLTATSKYPNGTLIKSGTATYLVLDGKLSMLTGDAYTANGLKAAYEHTVADISGYTAGSAITGAVSSVSSIVSGAGAATTTVTGSATVSLASDSPVSGTIIAAQASADLGHFAFSGTGTVTGVRISKIGVAGDTTLSNVYLYDGAKRLTDAGSVSNGTVNFSNGAGLFTISGTKVITVKADILTGTGGQTVGVAINAAADVAGVTVGGSFPVKGNVMSIATTPSDIAAASLGGGASITSVGSSVTAGTSNVSLWSDSLATTQRTTLFKGLTFNQIGSMTSDSITNISLFVDGVKAGSGSIGSDGILVFDLSATPVSLNTGTHTIEARGDVVKGSSRTFKLSLRNAADLVLTDSSYGVNIAPTLASGSFPAEPTAGSTTISSGTISVTTDPSFNTTQIVSSASNQTLGKWTMKAYGEDLKVMNLYASTTATNATKNTATTEQINNYAIYVNGVQVGSSKTYELATSSPTGNTQFGSTNLFTIPAGQTVTVELKGDIALDTSTGVTALMSYIQLQNGQVQGQTSFATTAVSANTTYAALNSLTVATGALSIAKNASYGNQTVAANVVGQKIGSFIITAGNADTVRVTNINVAWGAANSLGYATNTSDLYISENTSNKVSPQSSNNFAVDFTLQPNQSKTVDVFVTVGSLATADLGLKLETKMSLTARTGSNADASVAAASATTGQQITINNGSLSAVNFTTSTAITARFVLSASTVDKAAVYTIKAANAPIIIDEMAFHVNTSDSGYNPITGLVVNGTSVNMVGNYATTTGMNLSIPNSYAGTNIVVKTVMNTVGQNANISGVVASTSLTYIKYHAAGGSPQTVYYTDAQLPSYDLTAVATIPAVSVAKVTNLLTAGATTKLAAVNLGADAAGPINVTSIALAITTSSKTTVTSFVLKDASGNAQSNTVTSHPAGVLTLTFSNGGYSVGAGNTNTLYLYGTPAASSAWGTAGTEYVSVGLSSGSAFVWDDVNGNKTGLTGASIYGLTTDSISITN